MVGTRPAKVRGDATVGKILTQARLQRKVALPVASEALNIPVHHLRALEEGDLSVFSAEVYARGAFIKYAEFLGVHAEATHHAFLRVLSGARVYIGPGRGCKACSRRAGFSPAFLLVWRSWPVVTLGGRCKLSYGCRN